MLVELGSSVSLAISFHVVSRHRSRLPDKQALKPSFPSRYCQRTLYQYVHQVQLWTCQVLKPLGFMQY
ncbi:hypothetical protein AFLA_005342 [Aspergillus flavus NRRL3357]|nr:hypothetical protein AFLA_005342 [Aspergillus flavus NRRL3357]